MSALSGAWALYLGALAVLAVYGVHRLTLVVRAWRARTAVVAAPPLPGDDALPTVTVQLPLYNERAVAARAIAAAAALDWPRDRLELQVLDDSSDETVAICAAAVARCRAAGVDAAHLRRTDRTGWKAGALEAGRRIARGELVAVFDADFVPPPDFLRRTVGHFADPSVGMVQARWGHLNRDRSRLTALEAMLLDGHFAVEQAGRAAAGVCFNFNGTAGVWRAEAIADAGGWHADTLTEDLDLSYRAALAGWRYVYAGDVVAPAELPADLRAFKAQQHRWAKGSVECARKLAPSVARAPWSWRRRLEAMFHLTHNLPYLITLVLLLSGGVCLAVGGGPAWMAAVHASAAVVTAAVLGAFVVASASPGDRLRAVARLPSLVALTAGMSVSQGKAVIEALCGHRSPFVRTPKDGAVDGAVDGAGGGPAAPPVAQRYRLPPTTTAWLELAMAAYLAACTALAVMRGAVPESAALALLTAGAVAVMTPPRLPGKKRARLVRP